MRRNELVVGSAVALSTTPALPGIGGFGGQARADKDEWLTPPAVLAALGSFDLDPCAPVVRPWDMAAKHMTMRDNGLLAAWQGRVFCNPPTLDIAKWMARMAGHHNGVSLVFARTEADWFHEYVWPMATGLLFLRGRLTFCDVAGRPASSNSGAPSVLIAYGRENAWSLRACGLDGAFVALDRGA